MKGFAGPLLAWYRKNGRGLPWRGGADAYRVAVSEFMLQQTQVERVIPIFRRFLRSFPSWRRLAAADSADVIRAWKGLGYNLRALRLQLLAEEVTARHGGRLPDDLAALLALKGIGPYTARALLVFAHRQDLLAPDTNVRRVLTRYFFGPTADPAKVAAEDWTAWEKRLRKGEGYDVNQGLMDLGALVCKARKPLCHACPLSAGCAAFPRILHLEPERLPRMKKISRERLDEHGLPNRIYRGRIIDRLRIGTVPSKGLLGLGRSVREGFGRKHLSWLKTVLTGLEKDGLVRSEGGHLRLA